MRFYVFEFIDCSVTGESLEMNHLCRVISRLSSVSLNPSTRASGFLIENTRVSSKLVQFSGNRAFSGKSDGVGRDDNGWDIATGGSFGGSTGSDDLDWDNKSMWSTGLTKEHFDGVSVGRQNTANPSSDDTGSDSDDVMSKLGPKEIAMVNEMNELDDIMKEIEQDNKQGRAFVDGIKQRMMEMSVLLKQVKEPGARGSYLKDSEKTEMYRLHKENPEVYTVERLAKDYRIMRQRVHAILFLKEDEEEEERKLGRPLDDSVERLLDEYPE